MSVFDLPLIENGHVFSRPGEKPMATVMLRDALFEPMVIRPGYNCMVCDAHPEFVVHSDRVEIPEPCPYPQGFTTVTRLSVPSGRIVVADSLRPQYDDLKSTTDEQGRTVRFASYNSDLGVAQVVEAMAAIGCAFGMVLNTCPSFYRTPTPDSYVVANFYCPDADDDGGVHPEWSDDDGDDIGAVPVGYERLAEIRCHIPWPCPAENGADVLRDETDTHIGAEKESQHRDHHGR